MRYWPLTAVVLMGCSPPPPPQQTVHTALREMRTAPSPVAEAPEFALPAGSQHVADVHRIVSELAANQASREKWSGLVTGKFAGASIGNADQVLVKITDVRGEGAGGVSVLTIGERDSIGALRIGQIITLRGSGRQMDFYNPANVLLSGSLVELKVLEADGKPKK